MPSTAPTMHIANVFWSPDHDYGAQVANLLLRIDTSVKQLGQTIVYIDRVKQTQITSSKTINDVVESSYSNNNGFNNNDTILTDPLLINSPSFDNDQSLSLIHQKLGLSTSSDEHKEKPLPKVRSLAANYELHLDHLSDVSYSRESLSTQIDAKILAEISEFRDLYQGFHRGASRDLNDYLHEYNKLLKTTANHQAEYSNRCKSLEDFHDEAAALATVSANGRTSSMAAALEGSPLAKNRTLKPLTSFHQRSFSNSSARSSVLGSPKAATANNNNLQASPLRTLTRTISNAMSRQNSDDESDDDANGKDEDNDNDDDDFDDAYVSSDDDAAFNDDPDHFLNQLEFPMRIGASNFRNLDDLQAFVTRLYNDAKALETNLVNNSENKIANNIAGYFSSFNSKQDNSASASASLSPNANKESNTATVFITNHELSNWLKLNRSKTENSIKNIEAFGQSLINRNLIKLSVFKNSLFKINSKFQVTNENQIVTYEFTKFAKFVMEFDLEKHNILQQQKLQYKLQKKVMREELRNVKKERKLWEAKKHNNNNQKGKAHSRIPSIESTTTTTTNSTTTATSASTNTTPFNKASDYIDDLKKNGFVTPKNRSRANTNTSNSLALPKSTPTTANTITNYLSNQFKSLAISANSSPETAAKRKETIKQNIQLAEENFRKSVSALDHLKRNFESNFDQCLISFETFEKKKTHLVVNSLNYLSFLLMKQSEYEFKKFSRLNSMIAESNNAKAIELELATLVKQNSMFYYSPFTTFKFEKNDIAYGFNGAVEHKNLINSTSLFGTDVSLLPLMLANSNVTNNSNDDSQNGYLVYSVPIFLNQFLIKLYDSFLNNHEDKLNNEIGSNTKQIPESTLNDHNSTATATAAASIELGNFARSSWVQPFNILEAYNVRQKIIDLYQDNQDELFEQFSNKTNELNSLNHHDHSAATVGTGANAAVNAAAEFQQSVFEKSINELFESTSLTNLINGLKLWLLELPDSLISFVVFEKLRNVYLHLYNSIVDAEFKGNDEAFDIINYKLNLNHGNSSDSDTDKQQQQKQREGHILKILGLIPRSNLSSLYLVLNHIYQVSKLGFPEANNNDNDNETFQLLQNKFISDLTNPVSSQSNSFPLAHLLLRPSNKNKNKNGNSTTSTNATATSAASTFFSSQPSTPSINIQSAGGAGGTNINRDLKPANKKLQFFYKNFIEDLITPSALTALKKLIIDREEQHQKSMKLKQMKEKEAIRSIASANNTPAALSRNNLKKFSSHNGSVGVGNVGEETLNSRRSSSATNSTNAKRAGNVAGANGAPRTAYTESTTSGPLPPIQTPGGTPKIVVEGLALRTFGTKNRVAGGAYSNTNTTPMTPTATAANHRLEDKDLDDTASLASSNTSTSTTTNNRPNSLNLNLNNSARPRRRSFSLLNNASISINTGANANSSTNNSGGIKIMPLSQSAAASAHNSPDISGDDGQDHSKA